MVLNITFTRKHFELKLNTFGERESEINLTEVLLKSSKARLEVSWHFSFQMVNIMFIHFSFQMVNIMFI